jgi:PKD repeat protein
VQANFSASPTHGVAPLTVNFTNRSSGDYDTCIWSLGDGATHTGCDNFGYAYATEGDYTVTLTVSGSGGRDTKTRTNYISVIAEPQVNQPPQAVINGPTNGLVGEVLDARFLLIFGVRQALSGGCCRAWAGPGSGSSQGARHQMPGTRR